MSEDNQIPLYALNSLGCKFICVAGCSCNRCENFKGAGLKTPSFCKLNDMVINHADQSSCLNFKTAEHYRGEK